MQAFSFARAQNFSGRPGSARPGEKSPGRDSGMLRKLGQLRHDGGAARAEVGVRGVGADGGQHLPAAAALAAVRGTDLDAQLITLGHAHLRDEERVGQRSGIHLREEHILVRDDQIHLGLKALADGLVGAGLLQRAVDDVAHGGDARPLGHLVLGECIGRVGLGHLVEQDVAPVVARAVRHRQPDLIAGEGEDRGEHLRHRVEDQEQGGLRAAAGETVRAVAVQTVLDDIEVERAQVDDAEVVDGVGDGVELIVVVPAEHLLDQTVQAGDGPLVQLEHVRRGNELVRIEADEVVEAELARVAELQIVLAQLLEDLVGAADVDVVVGGACPQAQQVGAVLVEDLGGIHAVAQRLVHGLALAVHRPAVGDALLERSAAAQRAYGYQQGGLEPAAVLVKTLDIHGGGPEVLVALHGGEMGGAGVEPAVQRIRLLREAAGLAAVRAGEALGQDVGGVHIEPRV